MVMGFLMAFMVSGRATSQIAIAQEPVFTMQKVPGNLLLTPSVEWPTIVSVANLGNYTTDREYAGYFDPRKCYRYHYSSTETERHFYPVSTTTTRTCAGDLWSGNFLNWAATQTIDPFRSALTGGYRVKDTPTETWLEKARHTGQGGTGIYPNRRLPNGGDNLALVQGATPFNVNWMRMRIQGLGNKMHFSLASNVVDTTHNPPQYAFIPYDPNQPVVNNQAYEVSIRIKVCDSSVGVESNCKQYAQGWKPEGTIQQYADKMRYGIFGYLNDHDILRDGAVLRARQKWVGPTMLDANGAEVSNPRREWDSTTGVLIRNPDADDAAATNAPNIQDSGVINYLNKFGQMTSHNHKSIDPVSELFYAALRYYRKIDNVPAYSALTGDDATRYRLADGFPVITNWDDPMLHWCQSNVILGIGDIYTHRDKNLPGRTRTNEEPAMPSEVAGDNITINGVSTDVHALTRKVAELEFGNSTQLDPVFTGRENSAYIAGLAYYANTCDIRPDISKPNEGKTTVSTYWVDVLELQSLEGMARNQYALATKYGGFRVPENFNPLTRTDPLLDSWWWSNNETLTPFGSRGNGQPDFKRPDNFFVAGEANAMVESLTEAFAQLVAEISSSSTSAAASAAVLQTDTLLYTAGFRSGDWSGTLTAYELTASGTGDLEWDAEEQLGTRSPANRKIFTRAEPGSGSGGGASFQWSNLHSDQQAALNHDPNNVEDNLGEDRLDWLRGKEHASLRDRCASTAPVAYNPPGNNCPANFKQRPLGDIIHSDPQYKNDVLYLGANDGMLHAFDAITGAELFAYIPSPLLLPESGQDHAPLSRLMAPDYSHRYFLDGKAVVADVNIGGSAKTYLVGGMGAGGRTVFALDVTNPGSFSASDVKWEFAHPELGYNVGQPAIVRMSNGTLAAVFGNGYNSDSGKAALFVVNLETGTLIKMIETNTQTANGLASPFVTDWPEMNLRASRIYAGDLLGNLWAFDVANTNPNTWTTRLLFAAKDANGVPQPITSRPHGARTGDNQVMIVFGTGSYFRIPDDTDTQVQSLYGIVDHLTPASDPVDRANDLLQQEIIFQGERTFGDPPVTRPVRVLSDYVSDPNNPKEGGWFIDLNKVISERVISGPVTLGQTEQRVRFTTLIPDQDPCGTGRRGFLMDFNLLTGGRTTASVFDLNSDGSFTEEGQVDGDGNPVTGDLVTVGGQRLTVGGIGFGSGEAIAVIAVPEPSGIEPYELICDGAGNCEKGRPNDITGGRQSWRQLR